MKQPGSISERLFVPASHPALPGHFPGNPLIPGVVILAHVVSAAERLYGGGARIVGMPGVKFLTPVRPEQEILLLLTCTAENILKFECRLGDQLVASGGIEIQMLTPQHEDST